MRKLSPLVLPLTLVLLYLVLRQVGVQELLATVRGADLNYIMLAFCIVPFAPLVSVIKWQLLLKSQGRDIPLWYLFKLYLVGYFFNNFFPTSVGGDVVRVYELGERTKDPAGAMASVFMERLTGFIVLFAIAIIAFVANLTTFAQNTTLTLAMLSVVVLFSGAMWFIIDPRPLNWIDARVRLGIVQRYIAKFRKFHSSLMAYRDRKGVLAAAFFWSLVFHLLMIFNVYICARAFYPSMPLLGAAVVSPIMSVITMLPFTFNGIGIQEWGYVLLFTWLGIPSTVGLSAILLIRTKTLIPVLLGGLLYPTVRFGMDRVEVNPSNVA
jgi:uncharacterized protein (TIRG00374 family)